MKSFAAPFICLAAVGAVLAGSLGFVSYGFRGPEPHRFANLDAPLWTTTPRRVDPRMQDYERLPPLQVTADASSSIPANLVGVSAIAPPDPTVTGAIEQPMQEWMADSRHHPRFGRSAGQVGFAHQRRNFISLIGGDEPDAASNSPTIVRPRDSFLLC